MRGDRLESARVLALHSEHIVELAIGGNERDVLQPSERPHGSALMLCAYAHRCAHVDDGEIGEQVDDEIRW